MGAEKCTEGNEGNEEAGIAKIAKNAKGVLPQRHEERRGELGTELRNC